MPKIINLNHKKSIFSTKRIIFRAFLNGLLYTLVFSLTRQIVFSLEHMRDHCVSFQRAKRYFCTTFATAQ